MISVILTSAEVRITRTSLSTRLTQHVFVGRGVVSLTARRSSVAPSPQTNMCESLRSFA